MLGSIIDVCTIILFFIVWLEDFLRLVTHQVVASIFVTFLHKFYMGQKLVLSLPPIQYMQCYGKGEGQLEVYVCSLHQCTLVHIYMYTKISLIHCSLLVYSSGLFPLLGHGSMSVRPSLLDIYERYYLAVGRGLVPCLPGIVLGLLPGLEDESEHTERFDTQTLQICIFSCCWKCSQLHNCGNSLSSLKLC